MSPFDRNVPPPIDKVPPILVLPVTFKLPPFIAKVPPPARVIVATFAVPLLSVT